MSVSRKVLVGVVATTLVASLGLLVEPASAAPAVAAPSSRYKTALSPRLAKVSTPAAAAQSADAQSSDAGLPPSGEGSLLRKADGRLIVDIRATDTSAATIDALEAAGATPSNIDGARGVITASVAATNLAAVAAVPGVTSVAEELTPMVNGKGSTSPGGAGPVTNVTCPTGVLSEGDAQLNAATARSTFGVDGTGVKVGVLSDSYNSAGGAPTDVANGDLPGAANPCGHLTDVEVQADAAGADEGRAMAQIVHDLAPGSPLRFATAFNGEADFANQIRNLQTNGSKVIVDDVTYFDEPMYQDGIVAKAVDDVTAAGATYYSSAANSTAFVGGKDISSYEATGGFRGGIPCPASVVAAGDARCHDFDSGAGTDNGDTIQLANGGTISAVLGYSEPQGAVVTDLDVFLVDQATGNVVAQSINDNLLSQSTFEFVNYQNTSGLVQNIRLVIGKFAGAATPRFKVVFNRPSGWNSVQYNTDVGGDVIGPSTFGHNAALAAGTTAAVPYDNANTIETFSSRGPANYCWGPVTGVPAAPLTPCQTKQLDFAATDGVATSFFAQLIAGTWRFYGTSAAAPHAAAVGALLRQKQPCRTPAEILASQRASAVPLAGFTQADMGSGRVDAVAAMKNLLPCVAWASQGGGTGIDYARAVRTDSSGNSYVVGTFQGSATFGAGGATTVLVSRGGNDGYLAKYLPDGTLSWIQQFGGTSTDEGWDVAVDSSGNAIITGDFDGTATFGSGGAATPIIGVADVFLAKYNNAGVLTWVHSVAGTSVDRGMGVAVAASGIVYVTGWFASPTETFGGGATVLTNTGLLDGFVAQFSAAGAFAWARQFSGSSIDYPKSLSAISGGGVAVVGYQAGATTVGAGGPVLTSAGSVDGFVAKFDAAGTTLWADRIGGPGFDLAWGVASDATGNVYAGGLYAGSATMSGGGALSAVAASTDGYVVKLASATGATTWSKSYGGNGVDGVLGLAISGSTLFLSGSFSTTATVAGQSLTSGGGLDGFVAKIATANGAGTWAEPVGAGIGDALGISLAADATGAIITAGSFQSNLSIGLTSDLVNLTNRGQDDAHIAKLNSVG